MYTIVAGLIFFYLSINTYLVTMATGNSIFFGYMPSIDKMKIWFGVSVLILVLCIIISLYQRIRQAPHFECIIIGVLSIGFAQLISTLTSLQLITQPYLLMGVFDGAGLLFLFIIFRYLSHYYDERENNFTGV